MTLFGMPISAAISAVVVSKPDLAKQRTAAFKIERTRGFDQSTVFASGRIVWVGPRTTPVPASSCTLGSFSDISGFPLDWVAPPIGWLPPPIGAVLQLEPATEQDRCPTVRTSGKP